jgi:hypothetical protein
MTDVGQGRDEAAWGEGVCMRRRGRGTRLHTCRQVPRTCKVLGRPCDTPSCLAPPAAAAAAAAARLTAY